MPFTANGLWFPTLADSNNPPADFQKQGETVDARYGLTVANVAALAAIASPFLGMSVWVTTPGDVYVWNGTVWKGSGLAAVGSYTPTWTGSTGNPTGAIVGSGRYSQDADGWVNFFGKVVAPASAFGVGSGQYQVDLPVTAASTGETQIIGAELFDASPAGTYPAKCRIANGGSVALVYCDPSPVATTDRQVTPTVPITFAVSDTIRIFGTYLGA